MTDFGDSFSVDAVDGQVTVRGAAAIPVLLRLALSAKFPDGPNPDILFSPYVNGLIDELATVMTGTHGPVRDVDWDNAAIGVPLALLKVADVVRQRHAAHHQAEGLEAELALALKPHSIPIRRLQRPERSALNDLDLDRLEELEHASTPGPWFVRDVVDALGTSGVDVSIKADTDQNDGARGGVGFQKSVVATFLWHEPPDALSFRNETHARMTADARNALPELIRLARIGLETERRRPESAGTTSANHPLPT